MIETLDRPPIQNPQLENLLLRENSSFLTHINHFKKNFRQEGLPYDWYNLPGTGFMVNKQIDLIFSESKEKALQQTDQDIKGFILEYLAQGLIFPINFYIDADGNLVDKNYGNKKVIDTISSEERSGVVKETFRNKIQPFFVSAADGSIAVMISPSGWSGLHQENGNPITYPDSQTYIFQKIKDQVLGFTLRTDFNSNEHAKVLTRLTGKIIPQGLGVLGFVSSPALIDSQANLEITSMKDVVDIARASRDTSRSMFAYKNRLWEEAYQDLERREELWRYNEVTEKIAQEFKDYFMNNTLTKQETKEALVATILRIAKSLGEPFLTRTKRESIVFNTSSKTDLYHAPVPQLSYGQVLEEVQKLPGCAGGGSKDGTSLMDSITPRFGSSNLFERSSGVCKDCEGSTSDNHYHCPEKNCKKKYEDETNKPQAQRTKECGCGFKFGC